MHERILDMLVRRYKQPIMNNVQRGDYVECMIALALGEEWKLTSEDGWDWAAWDCEHRVSGARLEIKQSATRQSWYCETKRSPASHVRRSSTEGMGLSIFSKMTRGVITAGRFNEAENLLVRV